MQNLEWPLSVHQSGNQNHHHNGSGGCHANIAWGWNENITLLVYTGFVNLDTPSLFLTDCWWIFLQGTKVANFLMLVLGYVSTGVHVKVHPIQSSISGSNQWTGLHQFGIGLHIYGHWPKPKQPRSSFVLIFLRLDKKRPTMDNAWFNIV